MRRPKLILCSVIIIFITIFIAGEERSTLATVAGAMNPDAIVKIQIYDWRDYTRWKNSQIAVINGYIPGKEKIKLFLTIEDYRGISLFKRMISNAQPIPGAIDMAKAPPYAVEIYKYHKMDVLDLYLNYSEQTKSYIGMYMNENFTEIGYTFNAKDVEAFLKSYGKYLVG